MRYRDENGNEYYADDAGLGDAQWMIMRDDGKHNQSIPLHIGLGKRYWFFNRAEAELQLKEYAERAGWSEIKEEI